MTLKWYIYRDSESLLGPMTPEEIRDGLREGAIDPFDYVAKEGSAVRLQLIEVDEIFNLSPESERSGHTVIASDPEPEPDPEPEDNDHLTIHRAKDQAQEPILGRGQLHLAAQIDKVEQPQESQTHPKVPLLQNFRPREVKKLYFLKKSGQKDSAGPYSPSEIIQMFSGKRIPKKVRVIRLNDQGQPGGEVPLDKFLRLFGPSKYHRGNGIRANQPTSVLAERVRQGQQVARERALFLSFVSLVMFVLAGLIIGVSVFQKKLPLKQEPGAKVAETTKPSIDEKKAAKKKEQPKTPRVSDPTSGAFANSGDKKAPSSPDRNAEDTKSKISAERVERAVKARIEKAEKEEKARLKKLREELVLAQLRAAEGQKKQNKLQEQIKQQQESNPVSPTPVVSAPPPSPPPKTAPTPAPTPKPAPAPPKPSPSVSKAVALIDGSNASQYGPLSCDKSVITSCDGSCTVTCSGPQGPVTIMFFKGVWGPKIESKASSVYVSGFVRVEGQGPPRIIVSGVQ